MNSPPDILLFFGRLHVLLIHLPIVLILLLCLVEALARSRRFQHVSSSAGFILGLAVPCSALSALCGWLLSLAGGYDPHVLQWHKWLGISTAAVCALAGLAYYFGLKKLYRAFLWLSFPTLLAASHFGGSLTHGSDYLVRYAPAPIRSLLQSRAAPKAFGSAPNGQPQSNSKDLSQLPAFPALVQPILQQDCVSCHGPDKSKGSLRLDTFQAVVKGGKTGPAIVPGKSAEGELVRRLELPASDDDHMPPDGKPQPSSDDVALLKWWIDAGASADKTVADLKPTPTVSRILAARSASSSQANSGAGQTMAAPVVAPRPLNEVLPLANKLAADLSIAISPLAPNENWFQCNASIAGTNFGPPQLEKLCQIGPSLRWLDLAGTALTDAALTNLAAMPNLTRLHLERTAVTDDGLHRLACLQTLEYLDLYATGITDAGLDALQKLPRLKHLYLWQTKVSAAAAKAFADARVDKDQLQQWRTQIEQLKEKIRDQGVTVEMGINLAPAPGTNALPAAPSKTPTAAAAGTSINTKCPVSGKPVDLTKTVTHNGSVVAFCCDDCKAQFEKDPKPYLAKLGLDQTSANPPNPAPRPAGK